MTVRANIKLAQFTKPAEHVLYKALDRLCGGTSVVKGLNAEETAASIEAAMLSVSDSVVIPVDMSHADASIGDECMAMLFTVLRRMFVGDPELDRLEEFCAGVMRGGERVRLIRARTIEGNIAVEGKLGLASGAMYTSMVMVLTILTIVQTFYEQQGIRRECRVVNNGDDFLLIVPKRHSSRVVDNFPKYCLDWGFKAIMEKAVSVIEEVSFCQCQPVYDGERYIMVRDPRIAISKDIMTTQDVTNSAKFDYFRKAKADCGSSLTNGIPIYEDFYAFLGRGTEMTKKRKDWSPTCGMEYMARGLARKSGITQMARYSFWLAFDILPDVQVAIEEEYRRLTPKWGKPHRVEAFEKENYLRELYGNQEPNIPN